MLLSFNKKAIICKIEGDNAIARVNIFCDSRIAFSYLFFFSAFYRPFLGKTEMAWKTQGEMQWICHCEK